MTLLKGGTLYLKTIWAGSDVAAGGTGGGRIFLGPGYLKCFWAGK